MTDPHPLPPWLILVAEVSTGIGVGHALTTLPSWVGGGLSALVVGVLLRVLDPSLRRLGERLAARRSAPQPPPAPKDSP